MNVLTIGGSDPSAGAGIQGDMQTILAHGKNPFCVVTAITAQNSKTVLDVKAVDSELLHQQLLAITSDFQIHAIKTGLLPNEACVKEVAQFKSSLDETIPLVVDPVLSSGTGNKLTQEGVLEAIRDELMPLASLITPNLHELEQFVEQSISSFAGLKDAAMSLIESNANAVLAKGGHLPDHPATDLLLMENKSISLKGELIPIQNAHGTGCALASAIACHLAEKQCIELAVRSAKAYVTLAIKAAHRLGKGSLHLQHFPSEI